MTSLFSPFRLGSVRLKNRIVMAPMTRARCPDGIASVQAADYYAQRAGAGLIVSEGTPISREGDGFLFVPAIYSPPQVEGWKQVTAAVHGAGGTIFAQLWHVGRVSHRSLQEHGAAPVGPSDKQGGVAFAYGKDGAPALVPASPPRALRTDEIARVRLDFAEAAANAIEAGFDGVELHAANGYLFEQFLNPGINDRVDNYGGSVENRARLLIEVAGDLARTIGPSRVGVRLSPFSFLADMPDYASLREDYVFVAAALDELDLAYLHFMDQGAVSQGFDRLGRPRIDTGFLASVRDAYSGAIILAGGLDAGRGQKLIEDGLIDLVAMGRPFIANPDLVLRLERGLPIAEADTATFYEGGARGYTDYAFHVERSGRA